MVWTGLYIGWSIDSGVFLVTYYLARLEQKNRNLTKIEINEMLRLVRHVRTEIASNDTMPSGIVSKRI